MLTACGDGEQGYARSDNPLEAITVMHEMQLQGMPLQRLTYNSLLLACVRGKDLESALDILEDMKVGIGGGKQVGLDGERIRRKEKVLPVMRCKIKYAGGVWEVGSAEGVVEGPCVPSVGKLGIMLLH